MSLQNIHSRWWCAAGNEEVTTLGTEIETALVAALSEQVGKDCFNRWFGANARLAIEPGALTITVSNPFSQNWIRKNFRAEIESACRAVRVDCPAIEVRVDSALEAPRSAAIEPTPDVVSTPAAAPAKPRSPSLSDFVVGTANRIAATSIENVIAHPGRMSPLVLCGPSGVGKTHLLRGLVAAFKKRQPNSHALYITAEQFITEFGNAIYKKSMPSFRGRFRNLHLLAIDDLQFLSGNKEGSRAELFHTIDSLQREGRQLVFACDRSPAEWTDWASELKNRLGEGLVCRLDPPDGATRLGIVAQLAQRHQLSAPREVLEFVAARFTRDARQLSGALCRLRATSEATGQPISLAMAEEALADMIRQGQRPVGLGDIEKAVCEVLGVEPTSLQSARKAKNASHPRMLAMWLARKHTRAALSEIGRFFGRRTHSTVVSAQKRVDNWVATGTTVDLADHAWNVDDAIRQVEMRLLAG